MWSELKTTDPTLVLLHGFMGSAADWSAVRREFGQGLRVFAPNLPGHGGAPLPGSSFTMADVVAWLDNELDRAGMDRCVLVGYSMGGRIAMHYALAHSDRCVRLVSISASPGIPDAATRSARIRSDDAWADRLERLEVGEFLRDWYDQPVFRSLRNRPALLHHLMASRSGIDRNAAACVLRSLSVGRQPSLWDRLETLQMPTMAVAGALDGKYVEMAERMAVLAPNVATGIVADAGHIVHLERERAFLQLLGGFMGYLPPSS